MNVPASPKRNDGPIQAAKPGEQGSKQEPQTEPKPGPRQNLKPEPQQGPKPGAQQRPKPAPQPEPKPGPPKGPGKVEAVPSKRLGAGRITALTVPKQPGLPQAKPPAPKPAPKPTPIKVAAPAATSRIESRHLLVLISFVLMVLVPPAIAAWYLWTRAADQYASTVAFSVRTEEASSALSSFLGPLNLSGSSTSDTDILYEFVQSQYLVARIDEKLDLRTIWAKADPDVDPIFSYHPPGTIEDLVEHWDRMIKIFYDAGTGLMELRVLAFDPADAKLIAEEIYAESTAMINELSAIAREDAIGYARDELDQSVERLKVAREAMTKFRNRTQIVDPTVDLQGQAGLLNTLNQQLAAALIEADLLKQTTRDDDPRISQAERKINVIEARIEDEKRKLGIGDSGTGSDAFATLVGEYERLLVDREFAEQTYTAALAAYDAAQAEARRQSRYLAAHVRPTLAQKSEYPERLTLLGLIALFLFLVWTVLVLVGYSLRDRR